MVRDEYRGSAIAIVDGRAMTICNMSIEAGAAGMVVHDTTFAYLEGREFARA
jgi:homoaconitase/3-isopropylmalate dehydratase large subunit